VLTEQAVHGPRGNLRKEGAHEPPRDLAGSFDLLSFVVFLHVTVGEASVAGEPCWLSGEGVDEGPIVAVLRGNLPCRCRPRALNELYCRMCLSLGNSPGNFQLDLCGRN